MQKHKPIAKIYEHKDERLNREREQKRVESSDDSSSDDDSSNCALPEIDINYCYPRQEDTLSIEDFIQNLQAEHDQYFQQEPFQTPENDRHATNYYSYSPNIEQVNAQYTYIMNSRPSDRDRVAPSIKFESSIKVKFFNNSNPVSEIIDAKQYTTTFDKYQQTSDEQKTDL